MKTLLVAAFSEAPTLRLLQDGCRTTTFIHTDPVLDQFHSEHCDTSDNWLGELHVAIQHLGHTTFEYHHHRGTHCLASARLKYCVRAARHYQCRLPDYFNT